MKGKELIRWITEHNAEDFDIVVQYRDGGGDYHGGELVEDPTLANYKQDDADRWYDLEILYDYGACDRPANCIVL